MKSNSLIEKLQNKWDYDTVCPNAYQLLTEISTLFRSTV